MRTDGRVSAGTRRPSGIEDESRYNSERSRIHKGDLERRLTLSLALPTKWSLTVVEITNGELGYRSSYTI
jgi:hypothetical protein